MSSTRRLPRPGDYGVTPGGGWPMFLVRRFTGRPPLLRAAWAGHAAWCRNVWPDAAQYPVLISEATPKVGISQRLLSWDDLAHWRWSDEGLADGERTQLTAVMDHYEGVAYDWPSVVAIGIRFWIKQFRGHAQDHPDARLFCSEWIAWPLRDLLVPGRDLFPGVAPGTVTPEDLDRRIIEHGWST